MTTVATSQNGWPVATSSTALDKTFARVAMPNGVRPGDVAIVLGYVAEQFHARVEPLVAGWCWGWNYRAVTGQTAGFSNHASGTAIDLNAPSHPYAKRDTFTPTQRAAIRAILAELGGVVRWGGDYTGNRDDMHFEINASAADVAAVARRLTAPAGTPAPGPTSPSEEDESMILNASTDRTVAVPTNGKGYLFVGVSMGSNVKMIEWFGVGDTDPATKAGNITFRLPANGVITSDRPGPIVIPNASKTRMVVLRYSCDRDFTVWCA